MLPFGWCICSLRQYIIKFLVSIKAVRDLEKADEGDCESDRLRSLQPAYVITYYRQSCAKLTYSISEAAYERTRRPYRQT
jgi:hypothetical protein